MLEPQPMVSLHLAHGPAWTWAALGLLLLALVLFLRTLGTTLRLTRAHHGVAGGLAWLLLVPTFNLFWQFFLLQQVTKGIRGRTRELGLDAGGAAWGSGLLTCLLSCASAIGFAFDPEVPDAVVWAIFAALLASWLAYWWRLAGFRRELARHPATTPGGSA
jgi:hypothetical protein